MTRQEATVRDMRTDASVHKVPVLIVMILGAFVAILNQTLLNVAIPHLMNDFGVSAATVQWLSTGYMLTNGVLIPITAFLIGTFTTRQLFLFSMGSFTVGSVICSLAPSFSIMMIGRVIQAIGGGILMPLMMTVILQLYPPETRGKAMGTIGIAMFFAPAVGPSLSGWMIVHWSWRLLFYVVIPIAIVDIILAVFILKNVTDKTNPKFDFWGFVTSIIGFSTLLYGFSEAGDKGWGSAEVATSLTIGVVFLILFVIREMTAKTPMLNLGAFKYYRFTIAAIVSSLVNMAMFGAALLVPIYMQNIRGFTALQSGLLLLPGGILMGIMSPISGALLDKIGVRPLAIIGLLITTITTWQFTLLTNTTTFGHLMWLYTWRMFGMSFISMTIMTYGLNALPRHLNSHGTAASNTVRQVAASLGTALLVTIMTDRAKIHYAHFQNIMTSANPFLSHNLSQFGYYLASQLNQPLQAGQSALNQVWYGIAMQQSTINGINDAFIVATGLAALSLILSFFLNPAKKSTAQNVARQALPEPQQLKVAVPATK